MTLHTPKIAVVGAGIVGATTAFYLSSIYGNDVDIYDEGIGQATSAAAGVLCPWLSRRRNKEWYRLVKESAAMYPDFLKRSGIDLLHSPIYKNTGALIFKKSDKSLDSLTEFAKERSKTTPAMGDVYKMSAEEIRKKIPFYENNKPGLFVSGGSRIDGGKLVEHLINVSVQNGAQFYPLVAHLSTGKKKKHLLTTIDSTKEYDIVVLAVGAWLPHILEPMGYSVDIRPQKGQLAELTLSYKQTENMPVVIPEGEKDIIFFPDGHTIIGATHQDDEGYDLKIETQLLKPMIEEATSEFSSMFDHPEETQYRAGTRAYTSDYSSFIGEVPGLESVFTASGLGSTGLTAGPLVGKMLAQMVQNKPTDLPLEDYPIEKYVKKTTPSKQIL